MKPITKQDVARLLEGEIDDPHEASRILDAIESDPKLAALADLLSDIDEDDDEVDGDLPKLDPNLLPDLRRTRLGRLVTPPVWEKLTEGGSVTTDVAYSRGLRVDTFKLTLTRRGDSLQLAADWPPGLRPIAFLLTQFDLVKGRVYPKTDKILSYSTSVTVPDQRPLLASEGLQSGNERTRVLNPKAEPFIGRSEPLYAAAEGIGGEARGINAIAGMSPSTYFYAKCDAHSRIEITTEIPEGQDGDIVMAELKYPGEGSPVRLPVQQEFPKYGRRATTLVKDFPWPNDVAQCQGTLTIRPLDNVDLPLLNNDQVSSLLAWEDNFAAVPISANDSGQLSGELRYPSEREAAGDPETTWLLRLIQEGGEA